MYFRIRVKYSTRPRPLRMLFPGMSSNDHPTSLHSHTAKIQEWKDYHLPGLSWGAVVSWQGLEVSQIAQALLLLQAALSDSLTNRFQFLTLDLMLGWFSCAPTNSTVFISNFTLNSLQEWPSGLPEPSVTSPWMLLHSCSLKADHHLSMIVSSAGDSTNEHPSVQSI